MTKDQIKEIEDDKQRVREFLDNVCSFHKETELEAYHSDIAKKISGMLSSHAFFAIEKKIRKIANTHTFATWFCFAQFNGIE